MVKQWGVLFVLQMLNSIMLVNGTCVINILMLSLKLQFFYDIKTNKSFKLKKIIWFYQQLFILLNFTTS